MERIKIGVFGGTFDPPHLGHLILAAEACYQLGAQRVLWVVTAGPPHKRSQEITPVEHRVAMVQAAIAAEPRFNLSRVDIDRQAPHYAVDTVMMLKEQHPGCSLVFIMGGDSLRDLPTWHEPQRFVDETDILGVMRRPGDAINVDGLEAQLPGVKDKIFIIDAPLLEISSREIRERASQGAPIRYYLPGAVFSYIRDHNLYDYAKSELPGSLD
jgi:nicotinate-nucleotide adenylyltransferase